GAAPSTSLPTVQHIQSLDEFSSAMFLTSRGSCFSSRSLSRRRFLALVGAAACSVAALPPLGAGGCFCTYVLGVHEVPIPVRRLPRSLEGLTIAHITDTHLGKLGRLEERVVTAIQVQNPTVVVLTGDMLGSRGGHCQLVGYPYCMAKLR